MMVGASAGSLREDLSDWTDCDVAAYKLGVVLGLIFPELSPFATRAKHVFWSPNPVGERLHAFLEDLAVLGILERRDEPDLQFRWNKAYRGTWE